MRKGQQSLIIKAMNNGYSEACIKVLSDETMTLSTLNTLYVDLWFFKDRDEGWVENLLLLIVSAVGLLTCINSIKVIPLYLF